MSEDSLDDKALALIKSRPGGILQSDLWKDLAIDSRKCSRVIAKLEEDGKIKRTWETVKGTRTYRISHMPQKKEAPKKAVDFSGILVGGRVAPCIGCTYECEPDYCPDLGDWIEMIAREMPDAPPEIPEEAEQPEVAVAIEEIPVPVKAKKARSVLEKMMAGASQPEEEKRAEKLPFKAPLKAPVKEAVTATKKTPVKAQEKKPAAAAPKPPSRAPAPDKKPAVASKAKPSARPAPKPTKAKSPGKK